MEFRLKAYLDTSVFGALVDREPEFHQRATHKLFEKIHSGQIVACISNIVVEEIEEAPNTIKPVLENHLNKMLLLKESTESIELAEYYLRNEIFTASQQTDARHIACAVVHAIPTIVSWNFRHMVNISRRRKVNAMNLIKGYPIVDIISPLEFEDETDREEDSLL